METRKKTPIRYDVRLMRQDQAEAGLSDNGLAKLAKVGWPTIERFMSGKARTPGTAKKIAKALGYPVKRYIVGYREPTAVAS
jgi:plasmid maintenance system antidote protein VapI